MSSSSLAQPAVPMDMRTLISRLFKPGLTGLVVFTVGAGFLMGDMRSETSLLFDPSGVIALVSSILGTTLVAAASSVLNQLLERRSDAHMERTKARPLVQGAIGPARAIAIACILIFMGSVILLLGCNPLACGLANLSLAVYVAIYTPLKRVATLNTIVGAIPGAIPPLIGWAAARDHLEPGAWVLFAILFLWQVPHFLAIAWLYRDDYARGGLRMLPVVDESGRKTGQMAVLYSLALIPVTWTAPLVGSAGWIYWIVATLLGFWLLAASFRLNRNANRQTARRLFLTSIVHLPVLLITMVLDSTTLKL